MWFSLDVDPVLSLVMGVKGNVKLVIERTLEA